MARTKSVRKFKILKNDILSIKDWSSPFFPHSEFARKTLVNSSQRPTTSQKTPAYLYTHVGGAQYGGKTYIPNLEKHKKNKRVICTAPPMKSSVPVRRGAKVLHEIHYLQRKFFEPLLPYQPFKRLVREILQDALYDIFRDSMVRYILQLNHSYISCCL